MRIQLKRAVLKIFFYLSIILHPIFIPVYLAIWYLFVPSTHLPMTYNIFIDSDIKIKWLLLYILITTINPLIFLIAAKVFKIISHITLPSIKDRKYFFLLLGVYYWIVFYTLQKVHFKEVFTILILQIAVADIIMIISAIIINFNFKISIHTAGIGGITGFFMCLTLIFKDVYLPEIILSIGITTLIMITRAITSSHTFMELISGWLLGVGSSLLIYLNVYQHHTIWL